MSRYRKPFLTVKSRKAFPRLIPVEGEPGESLEGQGYEENDTNPAMCLGRG
jgi:hypothetical protein